VDVSINVFLTSALDRVSGQFHSPAALPPEKAPGTHWIGCWVGPRASVDDVEKRKFLILPGLELLPAILAALSLDQLGIPALKLPEPTRLAGR
jgi:hypothetical protein